MATGNGQCTAPAHIVMVQYPHLYIYTCLTFSADCAPFNGLSDGASDVWFSGGDCGHHICEVEATRCCAQCQRLTKLLVRHAFGHLHTHLRNGKSQIGGRLPEWGCTCFCATTVLCASVHNQEVRPITSGQRTSQCHNTARLCRQQCTLSQHFVKHRSMRVASSPLPSRPASLIVFANAWLSMRTSRGCTSPLARPLPKSAKDMKTRLSGAVAAATKVEAIVCCSMCECACTVMWW